jgi:ferredoxin-NADP reductase
MSFLSLLLLIAAAILLQIFVYVSIGFWRHWQTYQALRDQIVSSEIAFGLSTSLSVTQLAPSAWIGNRTFTVERKEHEDALAQVCSFYLVPEDHKPLPPFLPGQFLTFQLEGLSATKGAKPVVRCYSLSDAPHSNRYRISVKRAPAPLGKEVSPGLASNYLHDVVEVGSSLQVRAPAGHFFLDSSEAPVVLIGGGIGITPMLSMLNWSLSSQIGREIWLFYGVRNPSELVMLQHLETLATAHPNFHVHICLSDLNSEGFIGPRSQSIQYHQGQVDIGLLRRLLPLKPYHYYICGPTPMLQSLVPALEDWGVADSRIHFESFGPASVSRKSRAIATQGAAQTKHESQPVVVTFANSGKKADWEPGMGSLLELAESLGIAIDSGCRSGSCGTCQTIIRSGAVAYSTAPTIDPEPGSCLLCVATPQISVTLEL